MREGCAPVPPTPRRLLFLGRRRALALLLRRGEGGAGRGEGGGAGLGLPPLCPPGREGVKQLCPPLPPLPFHPSPRPPSDEGASACPGLASGCAPRHPPACTETPLAGRLWEGRKGDGVWEDGRQRHPYVYPQQLFSTSETR